MATGCRLYFKLKQEGLNRYLPNDTFDRTIIRVHIVLLSRVETGRGVVPSSMRARPSLIVCLKVVVHQDSRELTKHSLNTHGHAMIKEC